MKISKQEYVEEQGTVLEDDIYPAVLVGFGEMEGQYGPRLVWRFEIEHEGETVEAAAFTSYSMAEKPRKSNLLKFCEALNGGKDPEGMDLDDFLGKPCRVDVTSYEKQNGIKKMKVQDVKKPAKGQKGKGVEKPAESAGSAGSAASGSGKSDSVDFDESDFNDIPFAHVNAKRCIVADIL